MKTFYFKARNEQGDTLHGLYNSNSKTSVTNRLQQLGLVSERLISLPALVLPLMEVLGRDRVPVREVSVMMRQFATMYRAGVPLVRVLDSLENASWSTELALATRVLARSVHAGLTLSEAMRLSPKVFSPPCVSLIRTGELSGRLAESLEHCADILEEEAAMRRRIVAALTYPAFTMALFTVAAILMAFMVLPRFAEVLRGFNKDLPLPAALLMKASELVFQPWVLLVGIQVGLLGWVLLRSWLRLTSGRAFMDSVLQSLPPVRSFLEKMWMARLSYTMAALVDCGIPIVDAIRSSQTAVDSPGLSRSLESVVQHVSNGMEVSNAFYTQQFPATFVHLIKVGEETGQVVALLGHLRRVYDQEVEVAAAIFLNLLEPLLLLVMGLGVGGFLLTMMLPLISVFGAVAI